MRPTFSYSLLFLFLFLSVRLSAQNNTLAAASIINLDSLSDEDFALLEEYKDSFQNDLRDFMGFFNRYKSGGRDTMVSFMDRRSHLELGLDFQSRLLINGRTSGVNGVGFFPSVSYLHKYGLFASVATGFFTDKKIRQASAVPVIVPSAGFQRVFFQRWMVGAAYSRIFITYGSDRSKKLLNNNFSLSTGVDVWKRLIFTTSLNVTWSSFKGRRIANFEKRSVQLSLMARKEFLIYRFIGARVFTITPAFSMLFSTDNLAFIRERTAAEQTLLGLSRFTIAIDNFFGIVDVEPSVTLSWRIPWFEITATPALAIPFYTFDYETGTRVARPGQYNFYLQAGLRYYFAIPITKKEKEKKE